LTFAFLSCIIHLNQKDGIMESFAKTDLLNFLEIVTQKGWVNANTGAGWKSAVNKILQNLESDADVRQIDVPSAVLQHHNRYPGDLASGSLKRYEQRVGTAIAQFISWKTNPQTYKAPSRGIPGTQKPDAKKNKPAVSVKKDATVNTLAASVDVDIQPSPTKPVVGVATETSLALPFPLRPGFLAQIVIPRDLTQDEATRLGVFIQALAQTS